MSYMCCIDPLNTMYRVDSEQSMGDSDENIMEHLTEGGVTIMKTLDRKRQVNFQHSLHDMPLSTVVNGRKLQF